MKSLKYLLLSSVILITVNSSAYCSADDNYADCLRSCVVASEVYIEEANRIANAVRNR